MAEMVLKERRRVNEHGFDTTTTQMEGVGKQTLYIAISFGLTASQDDHLNIFNISIKKMKKNKERYEKYQMDEKQYLSYMEMMENSGHIGQEDMDLHHLLLAAVDTMLHVKTLATSLKLKEVARSGSSVYMFTLFCCYWIFNLFYFIAPEISEKEQAPFGILYLAAGYDLKGKNDKNRVFVVNLKHDGIFSPYPFSYIHGDEKQLTDFDFEGMSYDNLRELVRKMVHAPTGYESKWVVDLYIEHHGYDPMDYKISNARDYESPDSSDAYYSSDDEQPILGMRYDYLEQLKLALANYRVAGRRAGYFSKKVKAKKQLFTESHDDANNVGEETSKEGEGSSRNSDVSPKWTKSKIASSRKSGQPQCGFRFLISHTYDLRERKLEKEIIEDPFIPLLKMKAAIREKFLINVALGNAKEPNRGHYMIMKAWFISLLAEDLELGHGTGITVISDSHKGADDEEITDGGIPRVIVYGYDGLPMQPVALPSTDYIPGPEDPHTPPVPQDEDEREAMFIQPYDPKYVSEPIYPEYIPLKDEHVFPVEEQPLPPVDSTTAESPEYVTESDPEEDPEEYEHDETEDGPVDYPMDGGDDRYDDDGDSSRDDADDEDEDEEDEEEEEHPALADSVVVIPTVEPDFPPEGTDPVIPPPSTDISTTRARITVRLQAFISLLPEAEVERLLAMPIPSPSPPISLSPPSTGERLARYTTPPALSSPVPALFDAVTTALPSPLLPPSLYIPPHVDRKDDIPESEQPPRKRLCLSTLGSRYKVGESSTARPTEGQGIDYGFVSTIDVEARQQGISEVGYGIRDTWVDPTEAVPEIAPTTLGEVNTRVTELAELHERDTHDLYALLEDAQDEEEAYTSQEVWGHSIGLSQAVHHELQTHRDHVYAHETHIQAHQAHLQLQSTLIQTQHQSELLALRGQQRTRQPGPDARIPDHQDASRDADSHI
ncbi:hypothetical protein Tco_1391731 [Tanacetum coccineum]